MRVLLVFLLLASFTLAGCQSAPTSTYEIHVSTTQVRYDPNYQPKYGHEGDPAPFQNIEVELFDVAKYPTQIVGVCSTGAPCEPPPTSPPQTGYLADHPLPEPKRVPRGSTLTLDYDGDFGNYLLTLDATGKASFKVVGSVQIKMYVILKDAGTGETSSGCVYDYFDHQTHYDPLLDGDKDMVVPFTIGCANSGSP